MRTPPSVVPEFFKAHGHGNDYLVFMSGQGLSLTPGMVTRICDRWRGPGGDGIVVIEPGTPPDVASLRMFNPDGSEFERSGNGLRAAALCLSDAESLPGGAEVGEDPFWVTVGGDRVEICVSSGGRSGERWVRVDMGPVTVPGGPPFLSPGTVVHEGQVTLDPDLRVCPVAVGNPHAVVFGDSWTQDEVNRLGPYIAAHSAFPRGTNVQFVDTPRGQRLAIHIWERGVGRTASSGTSACAAAAAAVRMGLVAPGPITVEMAGGDSEVSVSEDGVVVLEGPAQAVYRGSLSPEFLTEAQPGPAD